MRSEIPSMIYVMYFVIFFILLLVTYKANGKFLISFPTFLLGQLFFCGLGAIFLQNYRTLLYFLLATLCVILGVVVSPFIRAGISYSKRKCYKKFNEELTRKLSRFGKEYKKAIVLMSIISLVIIITSFKISGIPLFSADIAVSKVLFFKGWKRLFEYFGFSLLSIISYVALFFYLKTKQFNKGFILFLLLINFFSQFLIGYKAQPLYFLIAILLFWTYVTRSDKRKYITLIPALVSVILLLFWKYEKTLEIETLVGYLLHRATVSNIEGFDYIIHNFHEILGGKSVLYDIKRILFHLGLYAEKEPLISEIVFYNLTGSNIEGEMGFSSNLLWAGFFYLNFGFIGMLVFSLLFGIITGLSHYYLLEYNSSNPYKFVFAFLVIMHLVGTFSMSGGFIFIEDLIYRIIAACLVTIYIELQIFSISKSKYILGAKVKL